MDALGVVIMAAGGFLLYAAVKNEHPWSIFTGALSGTSGTSDVTVDTPAGPDQLTPSSTPIPGVSSPAALAGSVGGA